MITPATTGTTRTRAAVATLRWGRSGSMAAPRPTDDDDPDDRADEPSAHLSIVHRMPASTGRRTAAVQELFRDSAVCSEPVQRREADTRSMADFLAVLGIIGFVVVMLGLIWALDRV